MTSCEQYRDAISARFDGEDPGPVGATLDAHLQTCAGCVAFAAGIADTTAVTRVAAAPDRDRTASVLAAIGAQTSETQQRGAMPLLRVALAVLGVMAIGAAVPALFLGEYEVPAHIGRHVGAFEVALGVGFLTAAIRPRSAVGLLPLVCTLAAFVVGGAAYDIATGTISGVGESQHIIEVCGVLVLWLLVREQRWSWTRA
jgi:predicted anti-sigma-YlaC factor YlaD